MLDWKVDDSTENRQKFLPKDDNHLPIKNKAYFKCPKTSNTNLTAASPKLLQQITWRKIQSLYYKEKPRLLFERSCHKLNTPGPLSRFAKFMLNSSLRTGDFTVALSMLPHAYWCKDQPCQMVTGAFVSSATLFRAVCWKCVGVKWKCYGQWVMFGVNRHSRSQPLRKLLSFSQNSAKCPKTLIPLEKESSPFLYGRTFFHVSLADLERKSLKVSILLQILFLNSCTRYFM